MKTRLFIFLSLMFNTSLMAFDAGLVGANGEVSLAYLEGSNIVIQDCPEHTVFDKDDVVRSEQCFGEKTFIPMEAFQYEGRKAIYQLISDEYYILEINELLEQSDWNEKQFILTAKAMLHYYFELDGMDKFEEKYFTLSSIINSSLGVSEAKLYERENLKSELAKINAFIEEYGEADANLEKKRQLESQLGLLTREELTTEEFELKIMEIIFTKVADLYHQIINRVEVMVFKNSSTSIGSLVLNQFKKTIKSGYYQKRFACGLSGTISERINKCKKWDKGFKNLTLVAITFDGKEIYQDQINHKFLTSYMGMSNSFFAKNKCQKLMKDANLGQLGVELNIPRLRDVKDFVSNSSIDFLNMLKISADKPWHSKFNGKVNNDYMLHETEEGVRIYSDRARKNGNDYPLKDFFCTSF